MIDHLGIDMADMAAATRCYDAVLGVLGHRRPMDVGEAAADGD